MPGLFLEDRKWGRRGPWERGNQKESKRQRYQSTLIPGLWSYGATKLCIKPVYSWQLGKERKTTQACTKAWMGPV